MPLFKKYTVINNNTDETVEDAFVLRPVSDPAAREAIREYATRTTDGDLGKDLLQWLQKIETPEYMFQAMTAEPAASVYAVDATPLAIYDAVVGQLVDFGGTEIYIIVGHSIDSAEWHKVQRDTVKRVEI